MSVVRELALSAPLSANIHARRLGTIRLPQEMAHFIECVAPLNHPLLQSSS